LAKAEVLDASGENRAAVALMEQHPEAWQKKITLVELSPDFPIPN
jgi:hypothetical protein